MSTRRTAAERQPKPKLAEPKPKVEGNTPATKVAKYDPVLDRIPETMHIIAVMWMVIIGYSLLVSYLSRGPWWEMIAHYLGFMTSLYFWHWQAHRKLWWMPFNKECHRLHFLHHFHVYPPNAFFGDGDGSEVKQTHDSFLSAHEIMLYLLLLSQLAICAWFGERRGGVIGATIFVLFAGYAGNFLHQAFHVRGHSFERFPWFHELRAFHYIHHKYSTKHNYSVMNVGLDWLMGSMVLDETKKESVPAQPKVSASLGGLSTMLLGLQPILRTVVPGEWAWKRGKSAVLVRLMIVALLFAFWFEVQFLLRSFASAVTEASPRDFGHELVAAATQPQQLQLNLIRLQDVMVGVICLVALIGPSMRPLVALSFCLFLREALVMLGGNVMPEANLWGTQVVDVFTTNHNDQTASGFTMLVVVFACELFGRARSYRIPLITIIAVVIIASLSGFIVQSLLAMRAVWSSNLLVGAILGRYAYIVAELHEPFYEGMLP